jgi:hypothetical protein
LINGLLIDHSYGKPNHAIGSSSAGALWQLPTLTGPDE